MTPGIAVLALHFQNDVLHPEGKIRVGLGTQDPARLALVDCAARLLQTARSQAWPIFHVRIAFRGDYADLAGNMPIMRRTREVGAVREGEWGAEFFAALAPRQGAGEFVITHKRISAFFGTDLEALLRLRQVQRLVVAGVATHSVVEGTVRDAADRGFDVSVVADACVAADRSAHEASLASMGLIAEVAPLAQLLATTLAGAA